MNRLLRGIGQAALYGLFALTIALFSQWPSYQHLSPELALIKLSISHQGQLLGQCVDQSAEDLAKLPPNMRAPQRCPRERSAVSVEVSIDGVVVHQQSVEPSGLSRDGTSSLYQRLPVLSGRHQVEVRMRDDAQAEGYNYYLEQQVDLQPAQILVIDFDPELDRITLR